MPAFTTVSLTTEGDATTHTLSEPPASLLPVLYEQIGCSMVECRDLVQGGEGGGITAWFDEEALFVDEPKINIPATAICGFFGVRNIDVSGMFSGRPGREIGFVGNVVFTGGPNAEGDMTGLSEGWVQFLVAAAADGKAIIPQGEQPVVPAEEEG